MKRRLPVPRTALASYHYARNWDLDAINRVQIIGDPGAYSARTQGITITTDELGQWADKWRHRLLWVAALDVAGNQPQTRRNWEAMNREYHLQSVPSIHMGDDPHMLDYYANRGCDLIGLGGLAGSSGKAGAGMRWLITVFRYAQEAWPGLRFHGWGVTGRETQQLPFWSVDSSGWGSGYRFGTVPLRDPRTGRARSYRTDGKAAFEPDTARLLTEYYGMSPAKVAVSNASTRPDIIRVSALAQMTYEKRMRSMHRPGISTPSWGIMNTMGLPTDGPTVALADSSSTNLGYLGDLTPTVKDADQ